MVEEIPARTGKMGHFYLGFQTQNFCRDVNKQELIGRRKSLSFRFHEILRQAQDDNVFGLRPKWKLIQGVLINGLCLFEEGTRAATAASKSSVGLDVKYKRLRHVVA